MEVGIKGYKCKECDFETKVRGYLNAQNEINDHFHEYHKDIVEKIRESNHIQSIEIRKIEHKYPVISLGTYLESIESKPAKQWECPRCKEKMGYGHYGKFMHKQNAFRNGKEYMCRI